MHSLQVAGIPAGAVLEEKELGNDPHLKERGYFMTVEDGPEDLFPGMIARLSEGAGHLFRRGPDLGQDNEDVLCGLLKRPPDSLRPIKEEDIGTSYAPE